MLNEREREFLAALLSANVAFAVIGGAAVQLHGVTNRIREDLDILFSNDADNLQRLASVELSWWSLRSHKIEELRQPGARVAKNAFGIELLSKIDGVSTAEVLSSADEIECAGLALPVISRAHLIQNKTAVGDDKDLEDVAALQVT